jgi:hypothetical protein
MKNKISAIFLYILIFNIVQCQKKDSLKINILFNSDSVMLNESSKYSITNDSIWIDLKTIQVHGMPKFNNDLDKNQYKWLEKKVFKVYPYFIIALKQYNNLHDSLNLNLNSSSFRKYVKNRQKKLSEEYEDKLKALTQTEGKIFSKLMYRSTGKTVYEIIKELRNGWSAFWWNAKARAFNIDLKEPFDPYHIRDDAYIESILQRAFQLGKLIPTDEFSE